MRRLAIDFGTSNTVAALAVDGQAPRTVTFGPSSLLPSAVYAGPDGITVGREAQRQARLDPARFEPNPKRRIDDGDVLLGDQVLPVVELIAAVLRAVAAEVRRQFGGNVVDEVRLTHPAQWGATRRNTLLSAARMAGLGNSIELIPEPVAAAAQFTQLPGRELPEGKAVAIYDLGGGTFDVAVVGRSAGGFTVLAEAGLADLGGLDFDQAILDLVSRSASGADPERWQAIQRPTDGPTRRAARALAEDVRAAKETLSDYAQTEVALPDPFVDVHLTRTEFEGLVRSNLTRSVEVLDQTLRNAGVAPGVLSGIFLVGGSSRIPLVARLIQQRFNITPVALDQPETAVALGALVVPRPAGDQRTNINLSGPASGGQQLPPMGDRGPASGATGTGQLPGSTVPPPGGAGFPPYRAAAAQGAAPPGASPTQQGPRPLGATPQAGQTWPGGAPPRGPQPPGQPPPGAQQRPPAGSTPAGTGFARPQDWQNRPLPAAGSSKKNQRIMIAAVVVAVVLVAVLIIVIAKPFSASNVGDPTSTGVSSVSTGTSNTDTATDSTDTSSTDTSSTDTSSTDTSRSDTTTDSSTATSTTETSTTHTTTTGTSQTSTPTSLNKAESEFLSSRFKMSGCVLPSGVTGSNSPGPVQVQREVICELASDLPGGKVYCFLVTVADSAAASDYLDFLADSRVAATGPTPDIDQDYSNDFNAGRVITAEKLPISNVNYPAVVWSRVDHNVVGVMAATGTVTVAQLKHLWDTDIGNV